MAADLRVAIVEEAISWIGTPYHHEGRVKGARGGIDCAMLLAEVYARAGMITPVTVPHYPSDWHMHNSEELYLNVVERCGGHKLPEGELPLPGDIVLYKIGHCLSHGGIVIQWPKIVHALINQNVQYAEGDSGPLGKRIAGFWRIG